MTWNAPIMGRSLARPEQMTAYALRDNPFAPDLAGLYLGLASRLGVRGDVAYAQALVETNGFRMDGWAERGRYNFGGLGVTRPGDPGISFRSPEEGVLAHLQALSRQAGGGPLPPDMPDLTPFLSPEDRGRIRRVGDLRRPGWPEDEEYGEAVARTLAAILLEPAEGEPYRIEQDLLPPGSPARPGARDGTGRWQGGGGIVIYRSASPHLDGPGMRALLERPVAGEVRSFHFVIDGRSIRQLVPLGEIAYHTDGRNHRDIGVMICERGWGTSEWEEGYRRLAWLAARLMVVLGIGIEGLSGGFWWNPVRHPYDPTHLGWKPEDGPATGLFHWNRLVADVAAARPAVEKLFGLHPAEPQVSPAAQGRNPPAGDRPGTATQGRNLSIGHTGAAGGGKPPRGNWVQAARTRSARYSSRRR